MQQSHPRKTHTQKVPLRHTNTSAPRSPPSTATTNSSYIQALAAQVFTTRAQPEGVLILSDGRARKVTAIDITDGTTVKDFTSNLMGGSGTSVLGIKEPRRSAIAGRAPRDTSPSARHDAARQAADRLLREDLHKRGQRIKCNVHMRLGLSSDARKKVWRARWAQGCETMRATCPKPTNGRRRYRRQPVVHHHGWDGKGGRRGRSQGRFGAIERLLDLEHVKGASLGRLGLARRLLRILADEFEPARAIEADAGHLDDLEDHAVEYRLRCSRSWFRAKAGRKALVWMVCDDTDGVREREDAVREMARARDSGNTRGQCRWRRPPPPASPTAVTATDDELAHDRAELAAASTPVRAAFEPRPHPNPARARTCSARRARSWTERLPKVATPPFGFSPDSQVSLFLLSG